MALSKIDVANMLTGATPVANGGTALTSGFVNGADPRPLSKPLIINGNMAVAQRGTSFADVGDGVYTLDRFETSKSTDGAVTVTQETLSSGNAYNAGFRTALKCDVTTADGTLASNQRFFIQQIIEGQNLQVLKFGTSNAEKLTLSFWVKATKTGTHVVRMYAYDDDRSASISYTVSSSDTWEHKVLNFPADTTGVIDNNNGQGIQIAWAMGAGASFQSGTLQTTWGSNSAANDFVGQVNGLDSTSNNFHLTGVQLEVGEFSSTTLPPFQFESIGDNLERCKRYLQFFGASSDTGTFAISGRTLSSNRFDAETIMFNPPMRAAPSVSQGGQATVANYYIQYDGNAVTAGSGSSFAILNSQAESTRFRLTANDSISANHIANVQSGGNDGTQFLIFDAEL
jgi:hypothetical protein